MEDKSTTQKEFIKSIMDLNRKMALMAILLKLNVSDALSKLIEGK